MYNATELVQNVDAIIVTFNYRVYTFGKVKTSVLTEQKRTQGAGVRVAGFFSTGDGVAAGNWGFQDCKLALQWVHRHIGKVGGDVSKITIFGESAGGGNLLLEMRYPHHRLWNKLSD